MDLRGAGSGPMESEMGMCYICMCVCIYKRAPK